MKKVPVYKEKDGVFIKVGEVSEKEAKNLVSGEPDVEEVNTVYVIEEEELSEEERKVHEFKAEEEG